MALTENQGLADMTKRTIGTVTQNGMVQSQPGTSVSYGHLHGSGVHTLSVTRYYPNLKNSFGGLGVFKNLDCNGMEFPSCEAAQKFAFDHGYIREYFTAPDLRARNIAQGETLKARALDFKERIANGTFFKR